MCNGVGIEKLVLNTNRASLAAKQEATKDRRRTGTFFCVITTAVSLPLTAMAVCPEPEMALNAYSVVGWSGIDLPTRYAPSPLTYLVQTSFWGEDGEISGSLVRTWMRMGFN